MREGVEKAAERVGQDSEAEGDILTSTLEVGSSTERRESIKGRKNASGGVRREELEKKTRRRRKERNGLMTMEEFRRRARPILRS